MKYGLDTASLHREYSKYSSDWIKHLAGKDNWFKTNSIASKFPAIFDEHLRYIANNFKLNTKATGKIDGLEFCKDNLDPDSEEDRGFHRLYLTSRRKLLTYDKKLYRCRFNSLVPLIPYAFKLLKDVPYSDWDRATINRVVDPNLAAFMQYDSGDTGSSFYYYSRYGLSEQSIIDVRNKLLLIKSGPKEGTYKNPATHYPSTAHKCMEFSAKNIPVLGCIAATQLWAAHPKNRTQYMILDPNDWDSMPPALVTPDVFDDEPKPKFGSNSDVWD